MTVMPCPPVPCSSTPALLIHPCSPQVHTLNLANNGLESLGGGLAYCARLHTLILAFNHLTSLSILRQPNIAQGTHIRTLHSGCGGATCPPV